MRAVPAFRQRVMRLEFVAASAQICGGTRGEFVACREEQLRPEALQERSPAFVSWQGRTERADALRGDNRNELRLTRQRKSPFVAGRVRFTNGRERVVLVADEQQIAPRPL